MSIFDTATSIEESPEIGQEEATPAEQQNLEGADNQSETDPETEQEAEDSSPDEGQEENTEDYVPAATHKELRAAFTRKAQEAAELKRQLEARSQGPQLQPPIPGQGQAKEPATMAEFQQMINAQAAQMREEGYHEAFIAAKVEAATANFKTSMLERRLDAQETQRENNRINADIDAMTKDFPDLATDEGFYMFANKVQEINKELGTAKITKRILQMAAAEVWPESKAQLYRDAKAKGKQEALDNIKAKQGVNTTISKKTNDQPKSLEDQLADSIMSAGRSGGIFG